MKYDKINFLYRTPTTIYASYMYYQGLETALRRNGLLYYAFDLSKKEPLKMEELLKYPILSVLGSWEPLFKIVKLVSGKQFIAEINPESLFPLKSESQTKIKKIEKKYYSQILKLYTFKIIKLIKQKNFSEISFLIKRFFTKPSGYKEKDYFETIKKNSEFFNLYFSPVEEDIDKYFGKSCYWFPSWAHTEILNDLFSPFSEKLGFIGSIRGRRIEFFSQDKNHIIEIANTQFKDTLFENAKELAKLINRYKFLVSPPGVRIRTMPGKVFEYMACKRLVFCYLDEEYMFKSRLLFEDGKEIVYFKTFQELEEKYRYYLKHPQEAEKIAQAGYEKVRKYHNADVRAKWFAKIVLHHANGGKYDESFNNLSQYGV
jgi:glycosyltransferase involved in cell wall biosynthesis